MEESINQNPEAMEALISNLFGNISSLKSAYIELQSAHTPYDPEKIQAADKVVISELKNLSEMKHFYRENNPKPVCVSPQDSRLAAEIQEQQSLLKTYEVMVKRSLMEQSLDAYDEKEKEMMMMIGSINRTELLSVLKAKERKLLLLLSCGQMAGTSMAEPEGVKMSHDCSEEDARKELKVLLDRVKSAATSLSYLRSKARILAVPGLSLGAQQLQLKDDTTLAGTNKNKDSLVIEDGVYTLNTLQSIEMVITDALESLLRRVTAAESETCSHKEKVIICEEEITRKTVQIQNLSLRLEQTERIVMTECESLKNALTASNNVLDTLLSSSRRHFQTIEARLVAKSTQLEGEKAQKEVQVQKLMEENMKLTTLLDKKEAQLLALNEQCKVMALNASNI
ncbi:hypothetical protein [Arabidopsis thaliana]|uniref:Uncharacterized protein AT4g36100 n=2 Tax=Arabidopsis thaliana TaxID=3702 RepID=O65647_ARATH|nr:hypothetical protein [Arabidopsis thaliana]CAB81519.1 hypothetical protein [Arabidopsis thaliana]